MADLTTAAPTCPRTFLKWCAAAFFYWVLFMAVLTPGVLAGSDVAPDWGREALRLTCCGLLGVSVTPVLLMLARRFPVLGSERRARNLAAQTAGVVLLSPIMILASCFLAAWVLSARPLPTPDEVLSQLQANTLLLIFCLALFLALIQIVGGREPSAAAEPDRLTVEERGRVEVIDLARVAWIEAQGNYQALHGADATRLVRETSAKLEARLPAGRFARIHRGTLVAVDQVRAITPLANGDATVVLADGVELRMSRSFRDAVRRRVANA